MKHSEYKCGNMVKVINIVSNDKTEHLKEYINMEGKLISCINKDNEYRYKVKFSEDNQHYFKGEELEVTGIADEIDTSQYDEFFKDMDLINAIYEKQRKSRCLNEVQRFA